MAFFSLRLMLVPASAAMLVPVPTLNFAHDEEPANGLAVKSLMRPFSAFIPYSVPCGPRRTSARSR